MPCQPIVGDKGKPQVHYAFSMDGMTARLNEIFKDSKGTIEAFGAAAEKTKQAAAKWLKTGNISKESLAALCDHYHVNIAWMLSGYGEKYLDHSFYSAENKPTNENEQAFIIAESSSPKAVELADAILSLSSSGDLEDSKIDAIAALIGYQPGKLSGLMKKTKKNVALNK